MASSKQTLYYSGHENFGLNCQAVCTHDLTFIYFGVVTPGSTNDIIAIMKTDNLMDEIRKLALGRFLVGDAAYELTPNDQTKGKMHLIFTCHRSKLELRWHLDD